MMDATQMAMAAGMGAQKGAKHVSDAELAEILKTSTMPVMVDFYAEWCGPCKLAAPIIDKLADEFKGKVMIVKVDTDANKEHAQKYGVMSIPTVLLVQKQGEQVKELDRQIGFGGEGAYRQLLAKAMPAAQKAA